MHGYIPKALGPAELVRALEVVMTGQIYVPPMLAKAPASELQAAQGMPEAPSDAMGRLTPRQREVLQALIAFGKKLDVRIEHLGNVLEDPSFLDQWKRAGVTPVMQPGFLGNFIGDYVPMLFPGHGMQGRMPMRTILDAAISPVICSAMA